MTKISIYAIISLICGILFIIPFAYILAIVFGIVALFEIKKKKLRGKALAIIGIVLGCLWFFSTFFLALLMPYF